MRKTARQFETSSHPPFQTPPPGAAAPRMPLIRLKPHKARVVIEDGAEMILVLKVSLARGESVELASGERLEMLNGMLRVRERGGLLTRTDGKSQGRLTYVPESKSGTNRAPAEFQVDVPLGPREFRVLLDLGRAGRLPTKIFMQAGERTIAGPRGVTYRSKSGRTAKFWDNTAHRRVSVSNLTFVVPVDVANAGSRGARPDYDDEVDPYEDDERRDESTAKSNASSAQVAELADEVIVFQSETRHLLTAILAVVGLTALILVVVSVLRFLR
ncbi:MAG TPA: hypothetical protein VNE58_13345 [Casimicrobiaceae bacterium]|nr:hypothetical protein [Casimicrobiaceae bacterium]